MDQVSKELNLNNIKSSNKSNPKIQKTPISSSYKQTFPE